MQIGGVIPRLLKYKHLRYIYYGRVSERAKFLLTKKIATFLYKSLFKKVGIEIDFTGGKIGAGLQLCHPYNITVNPGAVLGNNVVLFKGCTIGSIRSGKRAGIPHIGDRVVISCNAMVCGGISIGNDVLVASNAFVDFDVPDHSIVIGNPAVIHAKINPTKDYIRSLS